MSLKCTILSALCLLSLRPWAPGSVLDWFQGGMMDARDRLRHSRAELDSLGEPMTGNTVPEFGSQHPMLQEPPPQPPFVQLDLKEPRAFDTVAILPAVLDFQGSKQSPYAFPRRFRLDASDDVEFRTFVPLLVRTDVDFLQEVVGPVVVHCPGTRARYLRLTVTKLAQVEGRWTFALSELMVLHGNLNIAIHAPTVHQNGTGLLPRWHSRHLTDGRTPLGPPIDRSSVPEFDALFAPELPGTPQPWMQVDLGKPSRIDEVRLHPLHARQGADVPGYSFPLRFRVQVAMDAGFHDPVTIFENPDEDYSNPGNNPVVVHAGGRAARFVRVTMLAGQTPGRTAMALSELEVYSGGRNVSREAAAASSGDPRRDPPRPVSLLTDGHTSYGRLLELPEWLAQWERRAALETQARELTARIETMSQTAQRRLLLLGSGGVVVLIIVLAGLLLRSQRRHRREQEEFRARLARDMHDEIGSNLAGIAVLSETSALQSDSATEDWREINRIAHETSDAMREVLWLVGARQESGIDLMEHLQRVAKRLLPNHEVRWLAIAENLPPGWPAEAQREVFLFFKEALTNIQRHARAARVELSARFVAPILELHIKDDGCGFDTSAGSGGIGIGSLKARARTLAGTCQILSSGKGTEITLRVPLPHLSF